MVLERFAKKGAAVAGAGAGGFTGGFFSSPTFLILGALVVGLVFFGGDIRKAFGSLGESFGKIGDFQLPDISLPDITFPSIEFPDITFPSFDIDFPDVSNIFGAAGEQATDFFAGLQEQFNQFLEGIGGNGGGGLPLPPDVEDTGLIPDVATVCPCGSTVVQDIMGDVSQTCIPCPGVPEEGDPDFIGPVQPDESFMLPETEPFTPPITPPTPPGPELPPGFVGGGPSFEGGSIFETNDCFLSLNQLIDKYGVTASQAANIKAIACTAQPGEQPTDIPEEFDFGFSTGSGFGPGEDPLTEMLVTGGATLESEAQKASCVSCELFGLNCPACHGEI